MAIYNVKIQNTQYKKLANDLLKILSIIIIFHILATLYHGVKYTTSLLKCDKFYDNIILLSLSISIYHLVICELIMIV